MVTSPSPVEAECEDGWPFLMRDGHAQAPTLDPSFQKAHEGHATGIVEDHDRVGCGGEDVHCRADASLGHPSGARSGLLGKASDLLRWSARGRRRPPEDVHMVDRK